MGTSAVLLQGHGIAEAEGLAGFGGGDAGVGGDAVEVVETGGGGPGRQILAAQMRGERRAFAGWPAPRWM